MKQINGFSLIEVLVSLLILAIMLLGIDALQLSSLQTAQTSYYLAAAHQQLQNMQEMILASKGIDTSQIEKWNQQNKNMLPQGHGTVVSAYPLYKLNIMWGDADLQHCDKNKIGKAGCLHSEVII